MKAAEVIMKVTNRCNLACRYCYVEDNSSNDMSKEVLERALEQIAEVNNNCSSSIIWHGGEPLILGLDFFEEAVYVQHWLKKKKSANFFNSVQTNGTLVNDSVIEFCLKYDFGIGFSLDGPKNIHGKTRVRADGTNSFQEAFNGLLLAKEAGLSSGAIVVVNKHTLSCLDEIYGFFRDNKLSMKLNPLIYSGCAKQNIDTLGITPEEYAKAMVYLFDKYIGDSGFVRNIDPFDVILGNVATNTSRGCCTFGRNCQDHFVSISPIGDVYPCGRFDGLPDFNMGNIMTEHLSQILESELKKSFLSRGAENIKACRGCEFVNVCNAGCMNNGYMVKGDFLDKDYYCEGYKIIFAHIQQRVREEIHSAIVGG